MSHQKIYFFLIASLECLPYLHAQRWRMGAPLSVATITVELETYWWHCFRASNIAFISKTLIWRSDWPGVQTPWNSSPSGSRWAPHPERLTSVKRLCVGRDGFSVTLEMKRPLLSHHSKCFLIGALRRMGYSKGSTWGFHCANRAIWSGRKCSLPNTTKWAAALSFPRRDRKTLAGTCFCFLNHSNRSRMPCTLSNGTRTMFLCVRNSIPMNTKFWDGTKSDFSSLIISPRDIISSFVNCRSLRISWRTWFLTNQLSKYGNRTIALFRRYVAMATIKRVKT